MSRSSAARYFGPGRRADLVFNRNGRPLLAAVRRMRRCFDPPATAPGGTVAASLSAAGKDRSPDRSDARPRRRRIAATENLTETPETAWEAPVAQTQ